MATQWHLPYRRSHVKKYPYNAKYCVFFYCILLNGTAQRSTLFHTANPKCTAKTETHFWPQSGNGSSVDAITVDIGRFPEHTVNVQSEKSLTLMENSSKMVTYPRHLYISTEGYHVDIYDA